MSPTEFWQLTLPELFAAMDGHLEAIGAKGRREAVMGVTEAKDLFADLRKRGVIS